MNLQPNVIIWSALVALLHSRKFLIAALAVVQSIVFMLRPDLNQDVWKAIDALAAVLIGSIAHEDAAKAANPAGVASVVTTERGQPAGTTVTTTEPKTP